jgi:hypothetical protein
MKSAFVVRPADARDVRHVIVNMRELSAREAFASRDDDDRDRLADDFCAVLPGLTIYALCYETGWAENGKPCALVGCHGIGAGLGTILWVATDEWPPLMVPSHRFWRHHFMPKVMAKFRRVEFLGGIDAGSRRWLASLGFTEEGVAYRYGKNGEDFIHFAWVNPEWVVPGAKLDPPDVQHR